MKQLIKFNFRHYFCFFLILFAIVGIIIGTMFLKLESSFQTILIAQSYKPVFIIPTNDIYKVKRHQKVTLKINNRYYYGKFEQIFYDNQMKLYKAKISNIAIQMVPSSKIEANVVYDTKKLYEMIFE